MMLVASFWLLLIFADAVLILCKRRLAGFEDDSLHMLDTESGIVMRQQSLVKLLDRYDRWILALSIAAILYGIVVLAHYIYTAWQQSSSFVW